jgi:hypothetical protein
LRRLCNQVEPISSNTGRIGQLCFEDKAPIAEGQSALCAFAFQALEDCQVDVGLSEEIAHNSAPSGGLEIDQPAERSMEDGY